MFSRTAIQMWILIIALSSVSPIGQGCQQTPQVSILGPTEGSYTSSQTLPLSIQFSGGTPQSLIVKFNDVTITSGLTVSIGSAEGTLTGLQPGINKVQVSLLTAGATRYFIYMPNGVPENFTPIGTEDNYNAAIQERYDPSSNQAAIAYAQSIGYGNTVICPFEITGPKTKSLGGFLLNRAGGLGTALALVSIQLPISADATVSTTLLLRQVSSSDMELLDDQGNIILDCSESACTFVSGATNGFSRAAGSDTVTPAGGCSSCLHDFESCMEVGISVGAGGLACAGLGVTTGGATCVGFVAALGALGTSNYCGGFQECYDNNCCPTCPKSHDGGDPHFFGFDGLHFDHQLIGEFILLRDTSGTGLELQNRQQRVDGYSPCVTFNTAAAMRISGNVVEYRVGGQVLVDHTPVTLAENETLLLSGGGSITRRAGMYCFDANGNLIEVWDRGSSLDLQVIVTPSLGGRLKGLWGDADGDVGNDLKLRSGEVTQDLAQFQEEWRLLSDNESLFTYASGEGAATFTGIQDCSLTPRGIDIEAARQLYNAQCGAEPTEGMLTAIGTDLAAGIPSEKVTEWVADTCDTVTIVDSIGDMPVLVLSPANLGATHDGTLTAAGPGKNRNSFVYIDTTAFSSGTLVIDITVGSGDSSASFGLYPNDYVPPSEGYPTVVLAHAYDVPPGWVGSLTYDFTPGQMFLLGAAGNWGSPEGSTNTFSTIAHCNGCQQ